MSHFRRYLACNRSLRFLGGLILSSCSILASTVPLGSYFVTEVFKFPIVLKSLSKWPLIIIQLQLAGV